MTLIEVMVALLVTTIALLGALATVGITVRGAAFSRSATEASVLVQSKLEQWVSLPAANVTTSSPADGTIITESCLDANGNAPSSCPASHLRTRAPRSGRRRRRPTPFAVSSRSPSPGPTASASRTRVVAARQKDPSS